MNVIPPDYIQLCGVIAHVYDERNEVDIGGIIDKFGSHLWYFSNPSITILRDAITPIPPPVWEGLDARRTGKLTCTAVRFELHPVMHPDYIGQHPFSSLSAMHVVLDNGQQFASVMFEDDETDSIARMAAAVRGLADVDNPFDVVSFVGVFKVWIDECHDEDGSVEAVEIYAEFVRIFDIAGSASES